MHLCPLFVIDPSPFAATEEIDSAVRRYETVAAAIRRSKAPAAIHLSVTLMRALGERKIEPDLPLVEWVRTGWAAPDFASIPERQVHLALEYEAESMRRLGLEPGSLWVLGSWDRRIPYLVSAGGVDCLLLPADILGDGEPGVVEFLDSVLPVIPVLGHMPDPAPNDGLVLFTVEGDDPAAALEGAMDTHRGRILTPRVYLRDHRPNGRFSPHAEAPTEDRKSALLRRKMIRLATSLPDKIPDPAARALLDAGYGPAHVRGVDIRTLRGAHEALIRARTIIDSDHHRGDDWTSVDRIDWDADGLEELQIESARTSLIIDPAGAGEILVLDDKSRTWAVNLLDTHTGGRLCRFENADGEPFTPELTVEAIEEAKGLVSVTMRGGIGSGTVGCKLTLAANRLTVSYTVKDLAPGRIGLELGLAVGDAQIRVDGSEWQPVTGDVRLAGHRFRFGGPTHQILMTSLTPAECAVSKASGGITVWMNWVVKGSAGHEVAVDLHP